MDFLPLYQILQEVITATGLVLGYDINFVKGRGEQVAQEMQILAEDKEIRYPVIALMYSSKKPEYQFNKEMQEFETEFDLIFGNETEEKMTFDERYSLNFQAVIYPLIKEFFNQLSRNKNISVPMNRDYGYKFSELPYVVDLGKSKIDAVSLTGIKLSIKKLNCKLL